MNKILMLGTGNAIATQCYNTCFLLSSSTTSLLVDAGGGNGILRQLSDAGVDLRTVHHVFVTHAHTDHVLGVLWVVRMVIHRAKDNEYSGRLHVYSHGKVLKVLTWMCENLLPAVDQTYLGSTVVFHEIEDGADVEVGNITLKCFDIKSKKEKQFGFRATMPEGISVVCLGDEPYNPANSAYCTDADWLMSEAFCLYEERDKHKPYEKSHGTAIETAETAQMLHAKNLIIYHTEDGDIQSRKRRYTEEAASKFRGPIYVPDDLEEIILTAK